MEAFMSWVWVEEIEPGVKIGYRDRKNTKKKWWVRIYYPQFRRYKEKALFLDYADNKDSINAARKAARIVFAEVREGRDAGDHPHAQRTVQMVADLYEKKTLEWGRENDRLKHPKHRVHGSSDEDAFGPKPRQKVSRTSWTTYDPIGRRLKSKTFGAFRKNISRTFLIGL